MEIIHIILGKANPDRMNGVNKVVFQLATRQAQTSRKVEVWGITANPVHNYPVREFKTQLFQAYRNPFQLDPELVQLIKEHPEACYHIHGGWIPQFYSLSRLFKKNKIKFILTSHGAYNKIAMERSKWIKRVYFHLFEKHILKNAAQLHAIGQSELNGIEQLGVKVKTQLIPYGFESNIDPQLKHPMHHPYVVGFLGRIDIKTKGLDILTEAFRHFTLQRPQTELWIIGDGDDRAQLQQLVRDTGLKNIRIFGEKQGEEKIELLKQMHVFVHASRNEGIPGAVLEASAAGIPVIVTEATNLGSYYRQYGAGTCIPNESTDHLERALEESYQQYEQGSINSRIQNAIRMLKEQFSWNNLLARYDELYHS